MRFIFFVIVSFFTVLPSLAGDLPNRRLKDFEYSWSLENAITRTRLRQRHDQVLDSREGRETLLLFALAVRGWTSKHAEAAIERFLGDTRNPFAFVRQLDDDDLLLIRIQWAKLGRNTQQVYDAFRAVVRAPIDLALVTQSDLLSLEGISFKTADYFLMYSRENYDGVALDVHVLRYLAERFPNEPVRRSPPKKNQCAEYLWLRGLYRQEAARLGLSFKDLDIYIRERALSE